MSKFMLSDEHIGQKIYEIEEERHIVIKTRVVAKDDNEDNNDSKNETEQFEVEVSILSRYDI